jgi:hypothetical protein
MVCNVVIHVRGIASGLFGKLNSERASSRATHKSDFWAHSVLRVIYVTTKMYLNRGSFWTRVTCFSREVVSNSLNGSNAVLASSTSDTSTLTSDVSIWTSLET